MFISIDDNDKYMKVRVSIYGKDYHEHIIMASFNKVEKVQIGKFDKAGDELEKLVATLKLKSGETVNVPVECVYINKDIDHGREIIVEGRANLFGKAKCGQYDQLFCITAIPEMNKRRKNINVYLGSKKNSTGIPEIDNMPVDLVIDEDDDD